jgi:hypothetical protein
MKTRLICQCEGVQSIPSVGETARAIPGGGQATGWQEAQERELIMPDTTQVSTAIAAMIRTGQRLQTKIAAIERK